MALSCLTCTCSRKVSARLNQNMCFGVNLIHVLSQVAAFLLYHVA